MLFSLYLFTYFDCCVPPVLIRGFSRGTSLISLFLSAVALSQGLNHLINDSAFFFFFS